jgi:cbb3-type cytochrome oxidase maturation protein
MEILMLLIPLSVVLVLGIAATFWWSVGSGQFDDLEGPAHRIVADDDVPPPPGREISACIDADQPGAAPGTLRSLPRNTRRS